MRRAIAESRRIVAENLPKVIQNLADRARLGDGKASDATHLKLFLELSGVLKAGLAPPEKAVREQPLDEFFIERFERDKAEQERIEQEQLERQARTQ